MDDDHIGVMGEDFHHIASLGPLARLEWVGLVLYSHSVPNGVELALSGSEVFEM